ncbi:uncharacterized protein CBL_10098 [Carabus blaptoides fortunei]
MHLTVVRHVQQQGMNVDLLKRTRETSRMRRDSLRNKVQNDPKYKLANTIQGVFDKLDTHMDSGNLDNEEFTFAKSVPYGEQKRMLIEFLKQNPKLLSGKFSSDFTLKTGVEKWEELTILLNSIPGANKIWKNWRKTWHDLRSHTKAKKLKISNHSRATGGGPASEETLTNVDNEIIELICPVALEGNREIPESMVDINIVPPVAPINEEAENNSADIVTAIIAGPSNIINETSCTRPKKRNRSIEWLENSVVATNKLAEQLDKKIKIEDYYKKKLIYIGKESVGKRAHCRSKRKNC